jgi:hypothetical protein
VRDTEAQKEFWTEGLGAAAVRVGNKAGPQAMLMGPEDVRVELTEDLDKW